MVTHKEALVEAVKAWLNDDNEDGYVTDAIEIGQMGWAEDAEKAIRAYVSARGLVMVPKVLPEEIFDALHRYAPEADVPSAWNEILAAVPDPFKEPTP